MGTRFIQQWSEFRVVPCSPPLFGCPGLAASKLDIASTNVLYVTTFNVLNDATINQIVLCFKAETICSKAALFPSLMIKAVFNPTELL